MKLSVGIFFAGIFLIGIFSASHGRCTRGCDLALGSYYMWLDSNMSLVAQVMGTTTQHILDYNPEIPNRDIVITGTQVNVPFCCDCLEGGSFLNHMFTYPSSPGLTYDTLARTYYSNLTTTSWLERFSRYLVRNIPDTGVTLNVMVNCSCGDRHVSGDYGLFVTYPLRAGENLTTVAAASNLSANLVSRYNPTTNFSSGSGLVYIPGRNQNGRYVPLRISQGLSTGAIAGISVAGVAGLLLFADCLYVGFKRKRNIHKIKLLSTTSKAQLQASGTGSTTVQAPDSAGTLIGISIEKLV